MRRIAISLAFAALTVVATSAAAQDAVFTWVDGSGVRHYAQTAPEGIAYETRNVRDRAVGTEATQAPAPPRAVDQQVCDRARLSLDQLNSSAPLEMDKDGDGKPDPLTAEDRAAQTRLAEQAVRAYCAPAQ